MWERVLVYIVLTLCMKKLALIQLRHCQCFTRFQDALPLPPSTEKVKELFGRHGNLFPKSQVPFCS